MFFRGSFFIFFYCSAFSLISHANSNITADSYDEFKLEYAKINETIQYMYFNNLFNMIRKIIK